MWKIPDVVMTILVGLLLGGDAAPLTLMLPTSVHGPVVLWGVAVSAILIVALGRQYRARRKRRNPAA